MRGFVYVSCPGPWFDHNKPLNIAVLPSHLFRLASSPTCNCCGKWHAKFAWMRENRFYENQCSGQRLKLASNHSAASAIQRKWLQDIDRRNYQQVFRWLQAILQPYLHLSVRWLPCDYCYVSICSIYLHLPRISQTFVDMHLIAAFALSVAHARPAHARIASFTLGVMEGEGGGARKFDMHLR